LIDPKIIPPVSQRDSAHLIDPCEQLLRVGNTDERDDGYAALRAGGTAHRDRGRAPHQLAEAEML
jgi:hypothetical protein